VNTVRTIARGAWALLVLELKLYRSLLLWALRRRPGVRPGVTPIGYAQLVTPMMGLWIFASALEIPLVHVLTPWHSVRIALLVVAVWGLVWMVGLLAAIRIHPHLVDDERIRIRYGATVDVAVPWEAVSVVHLREADWPSSVRTLQWGPEVGTEVGTDEGSRTDREPSTRLAVAVGARTNLVLELRRPVVVPIKGMLGSRGKRTVTEVSLWVDEPRQAAALLRRRLPAPSR
jgi:hypothetical protein